MSTSSSTALLPAPRVVLVLSGAASEHRGRSTALELARMPQLRALARSGRVGRLRSVASHLPVDETSAAAALLGSVPPMPLDPGLVAAHAIGAPLPPGERCTLVAVTDPFGDPSPALDVERAVEALRSRLPLHRVVGIRHGNQILVAGVSHPVLPAVDGLDLQATPEGILPTTRLGDATVVVAGEGSALLGVAGLLGARTIATQVRRNAGRDTASARLRAHVSELLLSGAETIVVESRAAIAPRRGPRDRVLRERALRDVLELLDRELVGPLRAACAWTDACLSVTADLVRAADGQPTAGDVPLVTAGSRSVFLPEPAPQVSAPGTSLPPAYAERMVERGPVVASPTQVLPSQRDIGPRRFVRDPASGRTSAARAAAA